MHNFNFNLISHLKSGAADWEFLIKYTDRSMKRFAREIILTYKLFVVFIKPRSVA